MSSSGSNNRQDLCNFDLRLVENDYFEESEAESDDRVQEVEVMTVSRAIGVDNAGTNTDDYLEAAKRPNTKKGELVAIKMFNSTMDSLNQLNGNTKFKYILEASVDDLPLQLEKFFICLKRQDGRDYNGSSLETIYFNLCRVLRFRQFDPIDIKKSDKFSKVWAVVRSRQKKAAEQGLVPGVNASAEFSEDALTAMFEKKALSRDSPSGLISLIHLHMTTQLGFRIREVSFSIKKNFYISKLFFIQRNVATA